MLYVIKSPLNNKTKERFPLQKIDLSVWLMKIYAAWDRCPLISEKTVCAHWQDCFYAGIKGMLIYAVGHRFSYDWSGEKAGMKIS